MKTQTILLGFATTLVGLYLAPWWAKFVLVGVLVMARGTTIKED